MGFLWSQGPREDTGYGKTRMIRQMRDRINADFGATVLASAGLKEDKIVKVAAAYTNLKSGAAVGLFPVVHAAVADLGVPHGGKPSVLDRARALVIQKVAARRGIAEHEVTGAVIVNEVRGARLETAPAGSPLRAELLDGFAVGGIEMRDAIARASDRVKLRTGISFLDFALAALKAGGIERLYLFVDQLEDLANNRTLTKAKRDREVGRIRDLQEEEPYAVDDRRRRRRRPARGVVPLLPVADPAASTMRGAPLPGRVLGQLRTRTGVYADALTSVCFDAWLLCSHAQPGVNGLPDGRLWERAVGGVLTVAGFEHRQGPGHTTLFGRQSSSGVAHELDAAGRPRYPTGASTDTIILEAKAVTSWPKTEVLIFEAKVWDFYSARLPHEAERRWHPILVSAGGVSPRLRRQCAQRAVILVEPRRLPWPVLLWIAGRPSADMRLPSTLLSECVRLAPRAIATVQERWPMQPDGTVVFDPSWWTGTSLPDLDYVHDELSAAVLDLYDTASPGTLELRAADLVARLRRFAL